MNGLSVDEPALSSTASLNSPLSASRDQDIAVVPSSPSLAATLSDSLAAVPCSPHSSSAVLSLNEVASSASLGLAVTLASSSPSSLTASEPSALSALAHYSATIPSPMFKPVFHARALSSSSPPEVNSHDNRVGIGLSGSRLKLLKRRTMKKLLVQRSFW